MKVIRWIDKLPFLPTVIVTAFLSLAPLSPEPHVWEKIKMLVHGSLSRPIDIFDLFLHGSACLILIVKLARQSMLGNSPGDSGKS
ncbi:MAG: RND transporter [Gammaproteobacteria bacterium]|nr:RND transporter [Gammaproteobacteria bacterium]